MGRAYSLDLRERVVAAGASCRSVAATFKVSVASVVKWSQRFRATGSAAAHKVGGQRPYALQQRSWLNLATSCSLDVRRVCANRSHLSARPT
jgi:transposase